MFNKIKNIFWKNKNNTNQTMCSINFELNYDGTINIICYWPNFNESNLEKMDIVSTQFSQLLFLFEKQSLKNDIIETLTNLTRPNNLYDSLFVNSVLKKYLEYIEKNKLTPFIDEPLIKPSSVFNK